MHLALADHVVDTEANLPEPVNPRTTTSSAALAAEATLVVTEDARLRREIAAAGVGVEPVDGDAFAVRLWATSPAGVDETIRRLTPSAGAGRCRSPR